MQEVSNQETFFVEVILPLALAINYTYRVPFELNGNIEPGKRVIVQFGKQRMYTAIIKSIGNEPPLNYQAKYILAVIDEKPILSPFQRQFWEWISSYYLCNEGEVMNAALPAGLKLASETVISIQEDADFFDLIFNEQEEVVVNVLQKNGKITVDELTKLIGQKAIHAVINNLLAKNIIHIAEEVSEKYKPLLKSFVYLNPFYGGEENLKQLFEILDKAPKQLDALLAFISLSKQSSEITKQALVEYSNCGPGALKALVDKEVFTILKKPVSRISPAEKESFINFQLNVAQQKALQEIEAAYLLKEVVLLHGITSSGKTQIYIKLIEQALKKEEQVLFLVPEIALTTQIVDRISIYFGSKVGVYHSKFNNNERVEIWNNVLNGTSKIILGARSSVFLPFTKLGLIIVDEEHESSYKQYDPAPRYQARDAAIYLASLFKAKVLLGSATPSIESYYNAINEKYALVKLMERFGGIDLPVQEVISISESQKKKKMTSFFTAEMLDEIDQALQNKQQVILFQNRRGYATISLCGTCGFTPKCINCDVSLTYHKASGRLHCHYCGFNQNVINICPACGSVHMMQKGFGTERIEEELKLVFPDLVAGRLDLDSTRTKNSLQKILSDFQERKTQVLIGTQMVAKGLDFDNVYLIGVISADTLLNYPDFRAFERGYQLLAQVAGRAGRRDTIGKVIIQAYDASHRIIKQVIDNNYEQMFVDELEERKSFQYPPFSRLISIDLKHKDSNHLHKAAIFFGEQLRLAFGSSVVGPEPPLVARVRNLYIEQFLLRIEKDKPVKKSKDHLKQLIQYFNTQSEFKNIRVQVDVDPY